MFVSFFVYHDYDYGYSKITCYISKPAMILYTFAIPLAVMVVINVFMVLITVREIHMTNSPNMNSMNEKHMIFVFCRLSALTGGAWIFGFLHQIFQIQLFSYLHIFITGSQGVVIFFAFAIQLITKRYKKHGTGEDKIMQTAKTLTDN
jgi:hypothetical protein